MSDLKYSIEDKPPFKNSIVYSFQHVLTMLGATVAVPTIVSTQLGLSPNEVALLISNVLLAMGIATALQSYFGNKLPIIQGSSFAFLPPLLLIASQDYADPKTALQYMMGAIILGAVFQIIIGFLGLAGRIQKILTPVVIGPVIIMIGLSLFEVGASQASTYWPISILTIFLVLFFSYSGLFRGRKKGGLISSISTLPVLFTVLIVYLLSLLLSSVGIFPESHPASISPSQIEISFFRSSFPIFTWGMPLFNISFFVAIIIAYFVSTFESLGDYNAVAEISDLNETDSEETDIGRRISDKRINRGIVFEGIGCFIAGMIGANPTTSYSENIGLIGITRVASRHIITLTGVLLILMGFIPIFGSILSTISTPIMGGLYCILFGMIAGIGVKITGQSDLASMRNITIIGFTMFMAFGIPSYINSAQTQEFLSSYSGATKDSITGILGSSMAVASLVGLILDNSIPKKVK